MVCLTKFYFCNGTYNAKLEVFEVFHCLWVRVTKLRCIERRILEELAISSSGIRMSAPTILCCWGSASSNLSSLQDNNFINLGSHFHRVKTFVNSQAKVEMPSSETGVSHRLSTCSFCKCSLMICRPASPNWVAHKSKFLRAGSFMSCSAQADVTDVKAKLRVSRFPRAPPPSNKATSVSVARTGNVSFLGPPFLCCGHKYMGQIKKELIGYTLLRTLL